MDMEELLGQIQAYTTCQAQWQKSRQARAAPPPGLSWGMESKEQPPSPKQLPHIGHLRLQPLRTATSVPPGPTSSSPNSPTSPNACVSLPVLKQRNSCGSGELQAADSSRKSVVQQSGSYSSLGGGGASLHSVFGPATENEAGLGSPKAKGTQGGLLPALSLPKHASAGSSASSPNECAATEAVSPEASAPQDSPRRTRIARSKSSLLNSTGGDLISMFKPSHSSPALDIPDSAFSSGACTRADPAGASDGYFRARQGPSRQLSPTKTRVSIPGSNLAEKALASGEHGSDAQPSQHAEPQRRISNVAGAEKGKRKSMVRELLLRNQGNRSKVVSFRGASDLDKVVPSAPDGGEQGSDPKISKDEQQQQQQQQGRHSLLHEDSGRRDNSEEPQEMSGPDQGSAATWANEDLSSSADVSVPEDEDARQPGTTSSHRDPPSPVHIEHLGQQDRMLKYKQQINGFFLWIDIFSLAHHQPCQTQHEEDVKVAVAEAVSMIKCIGRVILILGARMLALSRIWVLYEIWSALKMKRMLYTISLVEPASRRQPRILSQDSAAAPPEFIMQGGALPGIFPDVNLKASKAAVPLHRLCILSNWLAEVESPKHSAVSLDIIAASIREGVLTALVREQKRPFLVQSIYAGLQKCRWTWRYKDQGMQPLGRDVRDTIDALQAFADMLFKREMETDPALQITQKGGDAELYLWQLIKFILRQLVLTRDEPAWIIPLKHYECIAERSFSSRFSNDILSEMVRCVGGAYDLGLLQQHLRTTLRPTKARKGS